MNIKEEMKDALLLTSGEMTEWGYQLWNNFIYGAYAEADHIISLKMRDASKKDQRTFVVSKYTLLLALEFNCSYGYAQKVIVGLFAKDKLASITNEFIEDMKELEK